MIEYTLILILVFFAPVLLVLGGWVKEFYRILLFFIVAVALCVYVYVCKNNPIPSLVFSVTLNTFLLYLLAALGGIIGIVVYSKFLKRSFWWKIFNEAPHFIYGINVVVSFLQQLLFFVYLLPLSIGVLGTSGGVGVTVACFAWLHVVYPMKYINIPLAAGGGILFTIVHLTDSNIVLAVLLHAVLNAVAVGYGYFCVIGDHPDLK